MTEQDDMNDPTSNTGETLPEAAAAAVSQDFLRMPSPGFFDVFYDGLFHPVQAYEEIRDSGKHQNRFLFYGVIFILFVSAALPMIHSMWKGGDVSSLSFLVPLEACFGFLLWFVMAVIISSLAYSFTGEGRLRTFLTLSALSTLPWILMGPLALLKTTLGLFGGLLGVLLGSGVWLWTVCLFALAIGVTYRLSLDRVMIVLVLPFAFALVSFVWVFGFFSNAVYLTP